MQLKNSLQAKIILALTLLVLCVGGSFYLIEKDTEQLLNEVASIGRISKINVQVLELNKTVESMQRNVTAYGVSGSNAILQKLSNNTHHIYTVLIQLKDEVVDQQMRTMIEALLALTIRYQENIAVLPTRYQIKLEFSNQVLPTQYQTIDEALNRAILEETSEADKALLLKANALWAKTNHAASLFLTQKKYSQKKLVKDYSNTIKVILDNLSEPFLSRHPDFLSGLHAGVNNYIKSFDQATQANRNYSGLVNVVMGGDAVEFSTLAHGLTAFTTDKQAAMQEKIRIASHENKTLILNAILFCSLLCFLFALIFHLYISRSINSLAQTFNSFIKGDFSKQIPQANRADEIGHLAKAAAAFRNVSLDLLKAKTNAENTSRIKSEFLANMSHEIRTPMNGILGMVQLLQNSPLNEKQKELLSVMDSSGNSLLTILNDVLDLSKLEAQKVELDSVAFRFSDICNELISLFCATAKQKNIVLNIPQPECLNVKVTSDPLRIKQVLINLLSNALKFTEQGSVSLIIDELHRTDGLITYQINVKDTGIGIPADSIGSLTEAFTQADTSITRNFGGTGLGLAISSSILALFDTELNIDSEVNKGTNFYFTVTLPMVNQAVEAVIEEEKQSQPTLSFSKTLKILIVDDNEINRFVLQSMLDNLTQDDILTAENGLEAVQMVSREAVDVVFMDMQMPVMDGISATIEIRNNPDLKDQYIVGLSANVMEEDRQKCINAGMNSFITKPLLQEDLIAVLDRYYQVKHGTGSNH